MAFMSGADKETAKFRYGFILRKAAVRVRWSMGYVARCRRRGAPELYDYNDRA
jgi:hypothetical protein